MASLNEMIHTRKAQLVAHLIHFRSALPLSPGRSRALGLALRLGISLFLGLGNHSSGMASDYHSPRSMALGGAAHAGPLLTDAIYLNPSFASFVPTYMISASYSWYKGGSVTDPSTGDTALQGRLWNLSLQDGRSEFFQAGIGYTQRTDSRWIHVGAGKAFAQRFGFGLGAKFVLPNDPGKEIARDLTFSMTGIATDWLQTVFIFDNIFLPEASKSYQLQKELILGTKINIMGILLIYADPFWLPDGSWVNGEKWGYELGMETVPFSDFYVRAGLFRNSNIPFAATRGRGYGLGFGWLAPRLSLDYAFQTLEEPIAANAHQFGFTVYF